MQHRIPPTRSERALRRIQRDDFLGGIGGGMWKGDWEGYEVCVVSRKLETQDFCRNRRNPRESLFSFGEKQTQTRDRRVKA